MRYTHLYGCWTIILFTACAASAEPSAHELVGVGGGGLERGETCGDPEPEEPPVAPACLFGEVFSDIRTNDALLITSETWIRSAEVLTDLEVRVR